MVALAQLRTATFAKRVELVVQLIRTSPEVLARHVGKHGVSSLNATGLSGHKFHPA